MKEPLIINLLLLFLQLSVPLIGAVLVGGVIGGVLQGSLKVEDRSIGFAMKFAAFLAALYLSNGFLLTVCREFALRIWGGAEYYGGL